MTEQLRYRIDTKLKKEAEDVLQELGCDPAAAISMFYSQIVRARALPFRPSEFPALEEYGVTPEQADKAISAALKEMRRNDTEGKSFEFKGKLR